MTPDDMTGMVATCVVIWVAEHYYKQAWHVSGHNNSRLLSKTAWDFDEGCASCQAHWQMDVSLSVHLPLAAVNASHASTLFSHQGSGAGCWGGFEVSLALQVPLLLLLLLL